MENFKYITKSEELGKAAKEWSGEKELAIDLECENNLHHYGLKIALVQISSRSHHWIVDTLVLKDLKPLIRTLEDKNIVKVFHDVGFDFRILKRELDCIPKNIFDTQIAALFCGREEIGLGNLYEKELGLHQEKKFQTADWLKRPLSKEMLIYATKDTAHLLQLKDKLVQELKENKRLEWIEEELKELEKKDYSYPETTYLDISGAKLLSGTELSVFHALFDERERIAHKVDRPVFFIFNNKLLLDFAKSPPIVEEWKRMPRVHPQVHYEAEKLFKVTEQAKKLSETYPKPERKFFSQKQKEELQKWEEIRKKAAEKVGIKSHLILDKEEMIKIVLDGDLNGLSGWKKELLR